PTPGVRVCARYARSAGDIPIMWWRVVDAMFRIVLCILRVLGGMRLVELVLCILSPGGNATCEACARAASGGCNAKLCVMELVLVLGLMDVMLCMLESMHAMLSVMEFVLILEPMDSMLRAVSLCCQCWRACSCRR